MFDKECIPFAPSLIESMRSLGYSFPAAIADLIDNSVGAQATQIELLSTPGSDPYLIIMDNGCGMNQEKLYEAMRYGSRNPLEEREPNDLGRFGLGLKSASLSQCRRLIVVTRQDGVTSCFSWDIDYVLTTGAWMLKGYSEQEILSFPEIERFLERDNGTYVYLSEFDRIKEGTGNIAETFNKCLNETASHLALVFHRFIEDGLVITLNNLPIKARDPFLSGNPARQKKKSIPIYINEQKILLTPYILPHLSKLSQEDLDKLGGKENLRNEQGFYVYRNRRLIIWGTWFRLERKDELNKLARVQVDIPNTLDYMWSIDVKKSTATLPDIIKKNMYAAVYESVLSSEAVHTYRGRKGKKDKDEEYIWERIKIRDRYKYTINRKIPQLKMLSDTLDEQQTKIMEALLKTLEEAFPSSALYVDMAKGSVEEKPAVEEQEMNNQLWYELQEQIDYIVQNGLPVVKYLKAFMKVEPYCNHASVIERIQKEIAKYE